MNCNSIKWIAALLLVAACGKEMPDQALNGGIEVGHDGSEAVSPGLTGSLTVSLPETNTSGEEGTKTALGDKVAGKYPTIWKEGDCMSLNGYSSLPLSAEDAGGRSARFVFREGLSSPFNLLYPASDEKDLVIFPETQHYVEGSFDPLAAPMWGTSESYTDVSLNHFSSLVRISISTEDPIVLKDISLRSLGGEPISGAFRAGTDANGAFDGSLSAENGLASVRYSFGESGLSLSAGETVVAFISIPAGNYPSGFQAVVRSSAYECRQLKFFSAGRSIAAGKVLEFPDRSFDQCETIWEYYVSASGSDSSDGVSEEDPMSIARMLALLQDADNTRLDKATFHFTPGAHTITSPIALPGKDIYSQPVSYTITGDRYATLDGGGSSQIFLLNEDNSHVTVTDFVLTNGSSTESGGLVAIGNAGPLFEHCSFTNTHSSTTGGAVRINVDSKGNGRFKDCIFSGNEGSSGGAIVLTNARTAVLFTSCTFSSNSASGSGGALYSTNGTATFENCIFTGNSAANGGAICATGAGVVKINGGSISGNTASSEGGALYTGDKQKSVYYINSCSLFDNTASKNGYVMYLNTSTAGNFTTLCINNSTIYNTAGMEGTNGSAVCNKGKTLILNSTLYGTTTKWGTFALGCHKNFEDEYGCLLMNSIFVNTAAGKPAIYQTGSNYYAIAKNCIASAVVDNTQFTQTDVVKTVPTLSWNGSLFTWNGTTTLPKMDRDDIMTVLDSGNYSFVGGFVEWLESIKYQIDGTEYDALDVDQDGNVRSDYSWAGAYQN